MLQVAAYRFDTGTPVAIVVAKGTIQAVEPASPDEVGDLWCSPALVDLQVNGYGGVEFSCSELTVEDVRRVIDACRRQGVARLCPTVLTQPVEVLVRALQSIHKACEQDPVVRDSVVGIHLEGPFISPEDGPRGAHPKEHCLLPDFDLFRRLQDCAGGRICLVTLAPELPGAIELVEKLVEQGVVVAIGHTAARVEQIHQAVRAGAKLSTHLGNGCHQLLHRHNNYVLAQLADDRLMASIIADGHHLPDHLVKVIVRAKGWERLILVSDMAGQAGQPPGFYQSPFCNVEVLPDGKLVVAGQREFLAGASRPLSVGIATVMRAAGLSVCQALTMATLNPAELLGLPRTWLKPGSKVDLLLFEMRSQPDGSKYVHLRQLFFGDAVIELNAN